MCLTDVIFFCTQPNWIFFPRSFKDHRHQKRGTNSACLFFCAFNLQPITQPTFPGGVVLVKGDSKFSSPSASIIHTVSRCRPARFPRPGPSHLRESAIMRFYSQASARICERGKLHGRWKQEHYEFLIPDTLFIHITSPEHKGGQESTHFKRFSDISVWVTVAFFKWRQSL